jgi:hypothetical protein
VALQSIGDADDSSFGDGGVACDGLLNGAYFVSSFSPCIIYAPYLPVLKRCAATLITSSALAMIEM